MPALTEWTVMEAAIQYLFPPPRDVNILYSTEEEMGRYTPQD